MNSIAKPNVLITGAADRIGRAVALDLAAHGFGVGVHYFASQDNAEHLVATITGGGGRAVAVRADLADETAVKSVIPLTTEALGPLTALVNNASVFENDTAHNCTQDSWNLHLNVNTRAPLVLSQMFAEQLPENMPENTSAAIINLLDQRVWNLTPFFMSYTVSKAALWTLTQTLALALAPKVRVNAIGPGPTLKNARQSDDDFTRQWSQTPLSRQVSTKDIADGVRYILGARSMTGQMIALDGGQHLGWGQVSNATPPTE